MSSVTNLGLCGMMAVAPPGLVQAPFAKLVRAERPSARLGSSERDRPGPAAARSSRRSGPRLATRPRCLLVASLRITRSLSSSGGKRTRGALMSKPSRITSSAPIGAFEMDRDLGMLGHEARAIMSAIRKPISEAGRLTRTTPCGSARIRFDRLLRSLGFDHHGRGNGGRNSRVADFGDHELPRRTLDQADAEALLEEADATWLSRTNAAGSACGAAAAKPFCSTTSTKRRKSLREVLHVVTRDQCPEWRTSYPRSRSTAEFRRRYRFLFRWNAPGGRKGEKDRETGSRHLQQSGAALGWRRVSGALPCLACGAGLSMSAPCLHLDHAGPAAFAPASRAAARRRAYPHRGFETVTIVYQGEVEHRDSTGAGGVIGPGDVQWNDGGVRRRLRRGIPFAGCLHRRGGTLEAWCSSG